MEALRWAALILNALWGLQELLLFAGPELWMGSIDLLSVAIIFLISLPFMSIFAILLPKYRTFTKIVLVLNICALTLLLANFIRLNIYDYHPVAFAITELVLTFLAMIPLAVSSIYFFRVIMRSRKSVVSQDSSTR